MKKESLNSIGIIVLGIILLYLFVFTDIRSLIFRFFPKENRYQKAYNDIRIKANVLPIPMDWTTMDNDKEIKVWTPKDKIHKTDTACRFQKIVEVVHNQISVEKDEIGYFADRDKYFRYVCEIKYEYSSKGWSNKLIEYFDDDTTFEKMVSNNERDSILKSWNFDYDSHLVNNKN